MTAIDGAERFQVAVSPCATQRGQVSAVIPRIPPYSVWQWLHRNMALAYPIGRRLETLSRLRRVPTFFIPRLSFASAFNAWRLVGKASSIG